MKAYLVTMLIIDHDKLGAEGIKGEIEANNWANDCIHPTVVDAVEADIGEWEDSHPLNYQGADYMPYFEPPPPPEPDCKMCNDTGHYSVPELYTCDHGKSPAMQVKETE